MASLILVFKQPRAWVADTLVSPFDLFDEDGRARSRRLLSGFLAGYLSGRVVLAVGLVLVSAIFLGYFVLWTLEVAFGDGAGIGHNPARPEQDLAGVANDIDGAQTPSDTHARIVSCQVLPNGFTLRVEVRVSNAAVQQCDVSPKFAVDLNQAPSDDSSTATLAASLNSTQTIVEDGNDNLSLDLDSSAKLELELKLEQTSVQDGDATTISELGPGTAALALKDGEEFKFNPNAPTFVPPSVSSPAPANLLAAALPAPAAVAQPCTLPSPSPERLDRLPSLSTSSSATHRTRTPARPNAKSILLAPHPIRMSSASMLGAGLEAPRDAMERSKRICHARGTAMAARRRRATSGGTVTEADAEREAERVALEVAAKVVDEVEDEDDARWGGF